MTSLPYSPSFTPFASASRSVLSTAKMCAFGEGDTDTVYSSKGRNAFAFSETVAVSVHTAPARTQPLTLLQPADRLHSGRYRARRAPEAVAQRPAHAIPTSQEIHKLPLLPRALPLHHKHRRRPASDHVQRLDHCPAGVVPRQHDFHGGLNNLHRRGPTETDLTRLVRAEAQHPAPGGPDKRRPVGRGDLGNVNAG